MRLAAGVVDEEGVGVVRVGDLARDGVIETHLLTLVIIPLLCLNIGRFLGDT